IEAAPKRQNENEAAKEIAKVVQTFAEFRFQVFGARNLAVAPIENTEQLKYRRAQENAEIIAPHKKHTGKDRQNKNGRRERTRMNRELQEQTCYAARNQPIQKSRNKTILWLTHELRALVKTRCWLTPRVPSYGALGKSKRSSVDAIGLVALRTNGFNRRVE